MSLTGWDNEKVKLEISRHDLRQVLKVIMHEISIIGIMKGTEEKIESLNNFVDGVKKTMVE